MAVKVKIVQEPFHTQAKTTMYAPHFKVDNKGNAPKGVNHAPGEEIQIHPNLVNKFKTFGYTEDKPVAEPAKEADKGTAGAPGIMTLGGTKPL
jgi:hypothetical protein